MWQRFTERARRVVFFAQEEAERNGDNYVSTEHLLLGLVRESDTVGGRILSRLGVSLDDIQEETRRQMPPGDGEVDKSLSLTPRAKRVLDLSYDEARRLDNNYIGTEHQLLGLIREGEGLAGRVLARLGISLDRAREEVIRLQDEQPQATPSQPRRDAAPKPGSPIETLWDRLNDPARSAVLLAHVEAARLGHGMTATEHLLLGLARDGDPTATLLKDCGVSLPALRRAVEWLLRPGEVRVQKEMRWSPRARAVINAADDLASEYSEQFITPYHLLIALVRDEESAASRVLILHGATEERMQRRVPRRPAATTTASPRREPKEMPNLSGVARRVVRAAIAHASEAHTNIVTLQHLFLALTNEPESTARLILDKLGVGVDQLAPKAPETSEASVGQFGLDATWSQEFRAALDAAEIEARHQSPAIVRTEHLLLGIALSGETATGRLLTEAGITTEAIREAIALESDLPLEIDPEFDTKNAESFAPENAPQPWKAALEQMPIRWRSLTERARQAIVSAHREAGRRGHDTIGTEYALFALALQEGTVAITALDKLGISAGELAKEFEAILTDGPKNTFNPTKLTPTLKRALDVAHAEMRERNNQFIGTEHLLIALLQTPDRGIAEIADRHRLTPDRIREVLSGKPSDETPEPSDRGESAS